MKTKTIAGFVSILALAMLAFGLFSPGASVQAAAGQVPSLERTPNPIRATMAPVRETLAALPTQDPIHLSNLLTREKLALSNQQTRLSLAHTTAGATQEYIDAQKAEGKDTSALESALAAFNQSLIEAESANAAAASLLAAPAGFDANGQVTDAAAARDTIRSAGQSLRKAHLTLTSATLDLRLAVREYRGA